MATKFRSDSTNAKPPAWCFHAIFPPTIGLSGNNPTRLVCFAYWLDLNADPSIDITESFILRYRPGPDDWEGFSAEAGSRLKARIQKDPLADTYHVILEVLQGDAVLDDDSWHNIDAGELPQFDTLEQHHLHDPGVDANGIHVVA